MIAKRILAVFMAAILTITACVSDTPAPVLQSAYSTCTYRSSQCGPVVSCLTAEATAISGKSQSLSPATRRMLVSALGDLRVLDARATAIGENACRADLERTRERNSALYYLQKVADDKVNWGWIAVGAALLVAALAAGGSGGGSGGCCRVCTTGKACGDTCINVNFTCNTPPGCACNG